MNPGMTAPVMTCLPPLPAYITQITEHISFTPPAIRRTLPRPWERVQSKPFLARHKSRKLWKRFRLSMEALRDRTGARKIEENDLTSEIRNSANAEYVRGVKRRRLDIERPNSQPGRGCSFLETKWELQTGKRKRKLVVIAADEDERELLAGMDGSQDHELSVGDEGSQYTKIREAQASTAVDEFDSTAETEHDSDASGTVDLADPAVGSETTADIINLIETQESTLVRSALRMNSLDGEDAALLSEFLSRAQAKRAANAAVIPKNTEKMMEEVIPNSPTVRSRRALEELDKNSPSPLKLQLLSSTKLDKPSNPHPTPSKDESDEGAGNQASPTACRRSNRTKLPKPQLRAPHPTVPNQIPVRRANGTEFVFLQRTEAQELALTTRRNTRRNKGDAQLPKNALQVMAKQQQRDEPASSTSENDESTVPLRRSPRKKTGSKQVSWREEQLVEYAEGKAEHDDVTVDDADKKKTVALRRNATRSSTREKHEIIAASPDARPATPRRVRRLAAPVVTNASNTTTADDNITTNAMPSITKSISVGTPILKRKKLAPKLSGSSLLGPPAKGAITKIINANSSSSTETGAKTITSSKKSSIPTSSAKTRSFLNASAGATPVAKRVRAKRVV